MRETDVPLVKLPDVPVTVTVNVPTVTVPVADRIKTLLVAVGFVLKVAPIPLGRPDALKLTFPLNPLKGLIVIVAELEVP